MTFESNNNYAIASTMLSDWLKNLVPVFQTTRSKIKTKILHLMHDFSSTLNN